MPDPTPHHRRSPMAHERDAAPDTSAEPTRYMVPGGHGIESHPAGLLYRRDDVLPVLAENAALRAEVARLRGAVDELLIAARQADGKEAHRIMPYIWPHIQALAALAQKDATDD